VKCPGIGKVLRDAIQTENFRVSITNDVNTVEICGALKNIVACGAGFCDGLKYGDNTKAALIRIGLKEMIRFCKTFYADGVNERTFFESCGVADLITTCYGGRNRRLTEQFVLQPDKTLEQLEVELLNGQKLQGPQTAAEVAILLRQHNAQDKFPLFVAVDLICKKQLAPEKLIEMVRSEPDD
jgi:glycerol-3-phosphate dehydrogenase (NAD+)